jgi:hypothetical protein
MSALPPDDDRRLVPTVAIIGNDAVLHAAPATAVQLAHACLRRGFSVAVPVSWGDELVAAEAMRRLAAMDRVPAVMCVCPFVRSRLLAPGPDLAPFLVSLVAPPVATARYLRTVYGEHGIHITYIGGCPSADDPSIDTRLTPDAFLADLAENGIALAEQPLVFDSIVPPDRRRWCSLPGGTPTAEVLWSEANSRTLIEIERDEAATELAQHLIGHEHVLLDLAPALGCVCSGAISAVPARSARVAVTSVEPPRALGPIVDPALVVPLDAPVAHHAQRQELPPSGSRAQAELMELQLDELLGTQIAPGDAPVAHREENVEPMVTTPSVAGHQASPADESPTFIEETASSEPHHGLPDNLPSELAEHVGPSSGSTDAGSEPAPPAPEAIDTATSAESETPPGNADERLSVRRRTPVPSHTRHPNSSIPKTTGTDGRALPRAYVAKRRTPPAGMPAVESISDSGAPVPTVPERPQAGSVSPRAPDAGASPSEPISQGDTKHSSEPVESLAAPSGDAAARPGPDVSTAGQSAAEPTRLRSTNDAVGAESLASGAVPAESSPVVLPNVSRIPPNNGSPRESAPQPESNHPGSAAAASAPNPSVFVILLLALIALAIFVLRSLG